jgi:hypothetical protein
MEAMETPAARAALCRRSTGAVLERAVEAKRTMVPRTMLYTVGLLLASSEIHRIPRMPTPESAAAFAKLVERQARLSEVSKQLRDAIADRSSVAGTTRYREVQAEWELALREMEAATEEFSATIKHLHDAAGGSNA